MSSTLPAIGSRYFHRKTVLFGNVVSTSSGANSGTVDLLFEDGSRLTVSIDDLRKDFDEIHQSKTGKVVLLDDERKSRLDETKDQGEDE